NYIPRLKLVCQMPGKVLFSSSVGINRVSELKAAERLFLLLKQDLPVQLSANTNPGTLNAHIHVLQNMGNTLADIKLYACLSVIVHLIMKTTGGRGIKPEPSSPDPVSFRISCKCTGSLSRYFNTQEVSRVIGVGLSKLLGWKTDLKNPQLEVNFVMGLPSLSFRLPLAHRSYIKTTGLRSTVAWAMASLAQIQPGFCVVDPMCGVGTILIEAAQEHKVRTEIYRAPVYMLSESEPCCRVLNYLLASLSSVCVVLPLPSASVDAVVCDLPFGRKFGTKTTMAANLPLILTEMERFNYCPSLSPSCSKQQTFQIVQGVNSPPTQKTDPWSVLQHSLPPPLSSLKHQATLRVSLGAIDGLIHKYVKTET
uniref:THUMP domain containing 2 n=1 Tax=Sander lucioperca TaxID=283035 RepID=A0A8C9YBM8_SANLU